MTEMENADLLNDEEVKRWYVVNTYVGHEEAVKEKKLKKSLDAKIILNASGDELEFIKSVEPELKNVFIVSGVEVVDNGSETKIDVELADGEKCERCWEHSVTVGADPVHPTLCQRCVNVLK